MSHPLPWKAEKVWRTLGDFPCLWWAVLDAAGAEVCRWQISGDNPDAKLEWLARFIVAGANSQRPVPSQSRPLEAMPPGEIESALGVLYRLIGEGVASCGIASPQFALLLIGADGRAYYTAQANRKMAVAALRQVAGELEGIPEVPR